MPCSLPSAALSSAALSESLPLCGHQGPFHEVAE